MVKYKVNLKFKENGKSLNEVMIDVLKIELEKQLYEYYNILNKEELLQHTPYVQRRRSMKDYE